jgi:LPXTG-site transpeptidase (sortase) family protein
MTYRRLLFFVSFSLGFILVSFGLLTISKRFGLVNYSFLNYNPPKTVISDISNPAYITINNVGVNLAIEKRAIESKRWPVSDTKAIYLSGSGNIGQVGNVVIYAHNWPNLFGPLKKIKAGDEIVVGLSDGTSYIYVTQYIAVVTSDQKHILNETSDKRLTLYTCTGFLDRQRLVVVAIAKT